MPAATYWLSPEKSMQLILKGVVSSVAVREPAVLTCHTCYGKYT